MSDWYQDPQTEENENKQEAHEESVQENTAEHLSEEMPAMPQEEAAQEETPAEPTPVAPSMQTPPYAAPMPPQAPYTPVQPPYTPPRSPYGAPSPYGMPRSPYGAPMPPSPRPQPPKPKKKKSGERIAIAALAVVCCLSLVMWGWLAVKVMNSDGENSSDDSKAPSVSTQGDEGDRGVNNDGPTLQITDVEALDDGGLATREIVDRNLDATVVLTMYTESSNSFYGYYYGDDDGSLMEVGGASGIIMSEDGYIITNSHCVFDEEMQEQYDRIDVTLYDGRVFEDVEIIGYDPTTDLAVIKIDAEGLATAEFGDSSALALGDRVITLGNSGGLQWSVSQGVLSGQARDVYEDTGYAIKCLQVDAIINPGSSGGPLINAYGQVVGVNSAKIVLTGYEGLGFSIPINEAKEVIDDLIKYGYVTGRVSLGIMGRTITSIGYEGFMIESINADSALKGSKAQAGDIITHVNDKRVTDYAEMRAELTSYEVGETITLTLIRLDRQTRETTEFDITVKLQESR